MTPNQQEAIRLYDEGSRRIFGLAGDSQRDLRQRIMHLLTGVKMPKAQCGVTALEDAITKAKNFTLPGFETILENREDAKATQQGEDLAAKMRQPIKDVSQMAGRIERNSPLFFGTGDAPTLF